MANRPPPPPAPTAPLDGRKARLLQELQAADVVDESELILAITTGSIKVLRMGGRTARSGTVVATDRRVILFTKKFGGHDVQDFAYGMIASVDHKKGAMFGNLDLAAAGDHTLVTLIPKDEIQPLASVIRSGIAGARSGQVNPGSVSEPDVLRQLKQLGELKSAGVLTEAEFEAKKADLLQRL